MGADAVADPRDAVEANNYSRRWFDVFEATHPYTGNEVDFLVRWLPNPPYRRILDVCSGRGRHVVPLARLGYQAVGVDRDEEAIGYARRRALESGAERATFLRYDVRDLAAVPGVFDGVVVLWQSFGFLSPAENARLLSDIADKLTPAGRVVLDLYNPDWWHRHQGVGTTERGGRIVHSASVLDGTRLRVSLSYDGDDDTDEFEWQLFTVDQITRMADRVGLGTRLVCTEFHEAKPPTEDDRVVQVVLERRT
ncbi:class I SAM-dependent methyltransferase [Plantactinospora endophytica]|uniref:Methyltransferase domain-containing protein n=1 Tax=Plantactinospora endophytica TaxID=673535 RepID=A0ABQ4DUZ2_9ACTN|nr:class I SAM-dependent methyltransferase [Plantactinospora endophytica]GIG86276.1 hypothetical protein Pen02_12120 [Plantactinospora endophytica]